MTVQVSAEHGNSGAALLAGTWSVSDAMPSFLHRQRLTWHPQQSLHKVIKLPTARSSAPWQKSGILEKKKCLNPLWKIKNPYALKREKHQISRPDSGLSYHLPAIHLPASVAENCRSAFRLEFLTTTRAPDAAALQGQCGQAEGVPAVSGAYSTQGWKENRGCQVRSCHTTMWMWESIVHTAAYLLVLYTDLESLLTHCDTKLCPIRFSVAWMSQCILQPKHPINKGLFKCH